MVVAISGGRYADQPAAYRYRQPSAHQMSAYFHLITNILPAVRTVAHGNAVGTDQYVANATARMHPLIAVVPYPVDTSIDGPWPTAGHNRNRRMLRDSHAEVLIAFPGGAGTADCVSQALVMGLRVWEWRGGEHDGEFVEVTRR